MTDGSPSRHDGGVRTRNLSFRRGGVLVLSTLVALAGLHWTGVAQPVAAAQTSDIRTRAEQGDADAQARLGSMYFLGQRVPQDDREAVRWFRRAAEQGNAFAQFLLGTMYHNGRGVPQDDREAVRWYRRAAEQGEARAQANLGIMYFNGQGVPQDYVQAHKWFNLAAASSLPQAREARDYIATRMSSSQIAEAQRLAREWRPSASARSPVRATTAGSSR